jgi:hypothetical protein
VKSEALATLTKLSSDADTQEKRDKREKRLRSLLRSPDAADDDWFMHVPDTFNDALDIRLTEVVSEPRPIWTQGANFSFAPGDTIYDTPLAYQVWSEALQHIRTCIQVSQATSVQPPTGGTPRQPGAVTFSVMAPNEPRTALAHVRTYTVTQDEFVRILITGLPAELPLAYAQ